MLEQNWASEAVILVVDDVVTNVELMKLQLSRAGYQILTASNGEEALEIIRRSLPDLILLDVMMPGMNGFEVCAALKDDPHTQLIPVVLVTALHEVEDRIKGIEAGADDFISKPFNRVELLTRVRSLLRIRKLYRQLERSYQEIEAKNAILTEELKMARHVQQHLLPAKYPALSKLTFSVVYRPTIEIGGDFYDFLNVSDQEVGLFLSDVSGHGVSAAMLTMVISTIMRAVAQKVQEPGAVLKQINEQFSTMVEGELTGTFVTAFSVLINQATGEVKYGNAGHPTPILIRGDGRTVERLDTDGFPLGLFDYSNYEQKVVQMEPGDKLVLYTDGIYDVMNKQRRILGMNKFMDIVWELRQLDAHSLSDEIMRRIHDFAGGAAQPDDICLMVVEYLK
ncbi:PP2C family protein-serine/threonine phosphatase [Heliophilum fasciatum]|uniref:Stage 0 sporulation protein A homolog n=1 Tax=Heliophilum fasciatum TaxID=35700 RepID=A0A4R2RK43_9FIRM|nr:response regulator [Heliophilum fasciatum]MCW2278508.1 sigma-B regulation protein RsbU (phosphoserine phosphatase) [Heliophilum fasciatum]TCP63463.1 sigma-B regulation protein RsbU (phosphoserine phosphatase) [Heliophilum fasciatum]